MWQIDYAAAWRGQEPTEAGTAAWKSTLSAVWRCGSAPRISRSAPPNSTWLPMHDLLDELWADDPPRSAIADVRRYVGNLYRLTARWRHARGLMRAGEPA